LDEPAPRRLGAHKWDLHLGELARSWHGRLHHPREVPRPIKAAFDRDAGLTNLLSYPSFRDDLASRQDGWRRCVASCGESRGWPALTTGRVARLLYDSSRRERLPGEL